MKPDFVKNIEPYLLNEKVLMLVSEQLRKDLYPYIDVPDQMFTDGEYRSIVSSLAKSLQNLDDSSHGDLLSMLYRIDVPQKFYIQVMESGRDYAQLAGKILDRELQKVLFRLHFDQQSK